eukprot:7384180-Prymnesium_polylepis.1
MAARARCQGMIVAARARCQGMAMAARARRQGIVMAARPRCKHAMMAARRATQRHDDGGASRARLCQTAATRYRATAASIAQPPPRQAQPPPRVQPSPPQDPPPRVSARTRRRRTRHPLTAMAKHVATVSARKMPTLLQQKRQFVRAWHVDARARAGKPPGAHRGPSDTWRPAARNSAAWPGHGQRPVHPDSATPCRETDRASAQPSARARTKPVLV